MKFRIPTFYSIEEFLQRRPEFNERGIVALFPTLYERDREDKKAWLESVLIEQQDGSSRCLAEHISFCTSGDALIVMESAEAAKTMVARSPFYKVGTEVLMEPWSPTLRVKLQYRGAFNRVVELEEVDY